MHKIDGNGATTDNRFTEGNPATGTPATTVTADWLNAIQDELLNILAAAGITPSKTQNNQIIAAIESLISGGGVAVNATGVTVADAGDFFSTKNVEAALQQLAQKLYAGTINAGQVRRTVHWLEGNQTTQASHAESIVHMGSPTAVTYTVRPDSQLNLPIGTSITILQAGAGAVSFVAGSGVSIYKPDAFKAKTLGFNATAVLYKTGDNIWRLGGMLEAA